MIELDNVSIQNGQFSLTNISFKLPTGEYAVLTGPTGSGKSTLLESIVGLRPIIKGRISIAGVDVSRLHSGSRGIGYVPQDICLFPKMTVENQICFSLDVRLFSAAERASRADELLELLELVELRNRRPTELSGGQQQRVAIGRALAFKPKLLCLDEPLAAIDVALRERLVELLKRIHKTQSTTILHVTHQISDLQPINFSTLTFQDAKIVFS